MKGLIFAIALVFAVPVFAQDCVPELVKSVRVIYPDTARVLHIEGTVFVQATIGTDGFVQVAMVTKSDNELLNEAALNAVVRYEFKPLPRECKVTIPIKFKLSE